MERIYKNLRNETSIEDNERRERQQLGPLLYISKIQDGLQAEYGIRFGN